MSFGPNYYKLVLIGFLKILHFSLQNDTESSDDCPNWSVAIDIILANNPTVKFALRGHLDFADRTNDRFYASRTFWHTDYKRLLDIFNSTDCSPFHTILLCNLQPLQSEITAPGRWKSDPQLHERLRILREAIEIERLQFPLCTFDDLRCCVGLISDVVCSRMCDDNSLEEAIDSEETQPLSIESTPTDVRSVDSSTSSADQIACSQIEQVSNAVDAHLSRLKHSRFHDNCIPLGAVRVGGYFERALLFKVLADRVGLPCTLHRSPHCARIAWNVVAQPTSDGHPVGSHIVNLMLPPLGCLLAIDTPMAQEYQQPSPLATQ